MIRRLFTLTISLLCALMLSACSRVGPTKLPDDHLGYNKAVDISLNQQLLLNIVRAHFLETSLYISIENITSRDMFQTTGGLSFFNPFNVSGVDKQLRSLTTSLHQTIKQEPSFIYAPETNDKYAIELLQPLRIKALYLVIESESDIGDILRLMLRRIGPYINFPALPLQKPYRNNLNRIQKFIAVTQAITRIYASNGYTIFFKKNGNHESLILPISKHTKLTHQQWALLKKIGIDPHAQYITFTDSYQRNKKNHVFVQIRSLINVTDFLSYAVTGDTKRKQIADVVDRQHLYIYRKYQQLLTSHLIYIKATKSRPNDAYVSIFLHDQWFSIMNSDISSKTTFRLFRLFNDLTQANTKTNNILISS